MIPQSRFGGIACKRNQITSIMMYFQTIFVVDSNDSAIKRWEKLENVASPKLTDTVKFNGISKNVSLDRSFLGIRH